MLVHVDKLFTVASLVGLLDLPFMQVRLFSHTFTTVSGPSRKVMQNPVRSPVFSQWYCTVGFNSKAKYDNMIHSLTANIEYMTSS